ncbi:MAG TPA: arylesterase [Steroidobacteraceae bacterium]|jgi:acyl-CoA thioesterase-1
MSRVIGFLGALLLAATLSAATAPTILVFGDSLSAGYGIHVEQGWVSLLARKISQTAYGFRVINASISGETSAGGLARLPHALELQQPSILILELGANDGLRGLPLSGTRANLDKMIGLAQARGVTVLLIGMRLPPNYGERYTTQFQALYTDLAQAHHLALVPFLLDSVALNPALMQGDQLHPNDKAQPLLLDTVWPKLEPLLHRPHKGS